MVSDSAYGTVSNHAEKTRLSESQAGKQIENWPLERGHPLTQI